MPASAVRPGRLHAWPWLRGLQIQTVHADDLAEAYHAAVTSDVSGPFNLAADPVIDRSVAADALSARTLVVPTAAARAVPAAAWHARLVPSEPALLDLVLSLPVMRTDRARRELNWAPRHSSVDALRSALFGMAAGEGGASAPLAGDSPVRRLAEVRTVPGERP